MKNPKITKVNQNVKTEETNPYGNFSCTPSSSTEVTNQSDAARSVYWKAKIRSLQRANGEFAKTVARVGAGHRVLEREYDKFRRDTLVTLISVCIGFGLIFYYIN